MDQSKLKTYAQEARRAFIAAVEKRAAHHGLTVDTVHPIEMQGSVALIDGRAFPARVAGLRKKLEERIARQGFAAVVEAVAYTWFNRLAALRYMEIHGFLEHGYRVLSHPGQGEHPEILDHAEHVDLPGLDHERIVELKLAGDKDAALYRLILVAQCNALHQAMPFLFPPVGDETELLLPDNLLHSDSLVRQMVSQIPEQDWRAIEIIGWLYQYYISEKKDQVIGKVVKSEDIPAATQLFTPKWIVKYMVQNSLGAQWLATYPDSSLRDQMEYYIEPAEQTDEVKAQLAAITPDSLDPEEITLMDPACGSGHILVEAYDLFKAIYLERGYRPRDVARLILEKNLFGLDIDERAAQLAGFALMMKARADDRRLFTRGVQLNVMAFVDSTDFDAKQLAQRIDLTEYEPEVGDLVALERLFEHATTFGSLLQVPEELAAKLPGLQKLSQATGQDLFMSLGLRRLMPLVRQAELLAREYDAVVANPPYMGRRFMNALLRKLAGKEYQDTGADLYAMFLQRNIKFSREFHHYAMIAMDSWLFGEDFRATRRYMAQWSSFVSLCHLGPRAFPEIKGEVVQTAAFVARHRLVSQYRGTYFDLVAPPTSAAKETLLLTHRGQHILPMTTFEQVPRGVFTAYRASAATLAGFDSPIQLQQISEAVTGLQTGDNPRFIRQWYELRFDSISLGSHSREATLATAHRWFPYIKGSDYRKWYGNQLCVVDWYDDGAAIRALAGARPQNIAKYFRQGVAYNNISKHFCARKVEVGFIFDQKNSMLFSESNHHDLVTLGLLHSDAIQPFLEVLSPKDFNPGALKLIPIPKCLTADSTLTAPIIDLVDCHREDWDAYERSWDFESLALLSVSESRTTLQGSYAAWTDNNRANIAKMQRLEEENNRLFINAYGLQDELTPEVPIEQITLTVNPAYRYGTKLSEDERWARFQTDTMAELVSYAVGCMMGRYSLDQPGLIYAQSGNQGFDPDQYKTFPADQDGIVPITDTDWFEDDACHRVIEFVRTAWSPEHLAENLEFLARSLGPKKGEQPADTLRRYLCRDFFNDHLKTYKKRPIYWLFSSGKQRAFECLVYLHRYHEGTLARMRTEYVIPLLGKMTTRIEQIDADKQAASSTAHRRKLEKRQTQLTRQLDELRTFDEKLRHYADQRIALDLDDGVKVNYSKFGDLLAGVKAVTGKAPNK